MGRPRYPRARWLLITADAGGSNGARLRLWKWELQRLANRTGLTITTCHFPPRHEQVEHDRASTVLVHQPQLARAAAGESGRDRQADRRHADRKMSSRMRQSASEIYESPS